MLKEILRLLEDYTLEELLELSDTSIEDAIEILLESGMIKLEEIVKSCD